MDKNIFVHIQDIWMSDINKLKEFLSDTFYFLCKVHEASSLLSMREIKGISEV